VQTRILCPLHRTQSSLLHKTDSHEEIIQEHGLCPDDGRFSKIVRVELSPTDGNLNSDPSTWIFTADQTEVPKWYSPEEAEAAVRLKIAEWKACKVFTEGEHTCKEGTCYAYGNATVYANNNATVYANNNATVYANNNATVNAYNKATVYAYDKATVNAYDNATVNAYDNATVSAYDKATVNAYDNATVYAYDKATVYANNNATVNANNNATVLTYSTYVVCILSGSLAVEVKRVLSSALVTIGK